MLKIPSQKEPPTPKDKEATTSIEERSSTSDVFDVVIIGAGAAGLACALALSDAGYSCQVLEGRGRPGGRLWSIPSGTGDGVRELGAEFVHGEFTTTWKYMKRFGLTGEPRGNSRTPGTSVLVNGQNYAYVDGRFVTPVEVNGPNGYNFFAAVENAINSWILQGGDRSISVGDLVKHWSNVIFGQGRKPTEDEQRLCHTMLREWYAADLEDVSIWEDRTDDMIPDTRLLEPELYEEDGDEAHWRIKEGGSALAELMAENLPVSYQREVLSVDWDCKGGVAVRVRNSDKKETTVFGHCAIVTLPLACLQQETVKFKPDLPSDKLDAIKQLGAGQAYKIMLTFEKLFWPEDLQFLFSPMSIHVWWPQDDGCTLTGYAGGTEDLKLLDKPDSAIIEEALQQLSTIFVSTGAVAEMPEAIYCSVVRWPEDPWARMAYSYQKVGCRPDARIQLREPCWPLLWAGEACHITKSALVHGALETGEHAARAALRKLQFTMTDLRNMENEEERNSLLLEVYSELLQTNFPVEGELDEYEDMVTGLKNDDGRDPELHILVARCGTSGTLAGCACYEYYPTSDCCLLSYVAVSKDFQRKGCCQTMMRHMELQLVARLRGSAREGRDLCPIFAETHMISVDDGIMDPLERQQVLANLGFRCLDFNYTQPPLNDQMEPCGGLRLLVRSQDSLPSKTVVAYLDGFAGSVCGWDDSWKNEPYYVEQIKELTSRSDIPATSTTPW